MLEKSSGNDRGNTGLTAMRRQTNERRSRSGLRLSSTCQTPQRACSSCIVSECDVTSSYTLMYAAETGMDLAGFPACLTSAGGQNQGVQRSHARTPTEQCSATHSAFALPIITAPCG